MMIVKLLSFRSSLHLASKFTFKLQLAKSFSSLNMRPQGIVADFSLVKMTPSVIQTGTDELIQRMRADYVKIADLKKEDITFDNSIQALLNLDVQLSIEEKPFVCPQHVSTDKEVRNASVEAEKKMNAFGVEISTNKKIFDNVGHFKEKFGLDHLSAEVRRYVKKTLIDGKRTGLHLDEAKRDEVKRIRTRMSDLCSNFSSNMNEEKTILHFTPDELAGVPQDLVNSFEKDDEGKCKVTLKYPHFFPVTRKCRVADTRYKIEKAYQSRCLEENTNILEELIRLRHSLATLLGYENHATYTQEVLMAKNPETVSKFLGGLSEKLQPLWKQERDELLKLKEEECQKYGYDFNGKLDFWDVRYLTNLVEETRYAVDKQKLKEYFPMQTVTKGLLEIYQTLLGLVFTEIQNPEKWHDEVQMFQVDDAESKETLGYFYLDLFPREGKFGHAAVSALQPGCIGPDGKRQPSVCVMMANFSKPTETKPALLDHDEVETYFHEFGHVMHYTCARAETAKFAGYQTERDFLEAPSQMLENWCWEEEPLRKMSGHFEDGSPIPKDLLDNLVASRHANAGAFNLRQIILGTFDQTIHTQAEADTTKVFAETYKNILGVETIEHTNMSASFAHLAGTMGYDAQYYSYMWSEVYSFDMFEGRFKKEGLLNPKVGADYRNRVLAPGGSKDAIELLRDFLGRDPSDDAFLKSKGLN